MKIAFLCKRQYMSKDVILDQYARLYEIPNQLALLGHEVECYCLSYQAHAEGIWDESNQFKKLKWHAKSYPKYKKFQILNYPFLLLKQLQSFKPELIIAASDLPHIIIGQWIAQKLNIPFIADLYDNFEAYGQARLPFLKSLFHRALKQAHIITTTSFSLAEKIKSQHPQVPYIHPMPSTINQDLFTIGDKFKARQALELPLEGKLVGTAGGLTKMKGIEDLWNAWDIIKTKYDDIYLVLAGPTEPDTPLPQGENVIYLGLLSHQEVATLFQALDIGVMCIPNDEFGRYCFPQKAYEMLSTNLCVVASSVGDVKHILASHSLYEFGHGEALANRLEQQFSKAKLNDIEILDWKTTITKLNNKIEAVLAH